MRPRGFLSAVAIYGTVFGIGFAVGFWLLGVITGVSFRGDALMAFLFLFVIAALPFGLLGGYLLGPTTRTFNYEFTEVFKDRLEESLLALGYHLYNESPQHLTYRSVSGYLVADIIVDTGTTPVRVSGPRQMLRRLGSMIGKAKTEF